MTEQTEAFPLTAEEKRLVKLKDLRTFLVDECDKRDKAVESAADKRDDAYGRLNDLDEVITSLEVSIPLDPKTGELKAV